MARHNGLPTFDREHGGSNQWNVQVKYISDDQDIECEGKPDGKCGSKIQTGALPKAFKALK